MNPSAILVEEPVESPRRIEPATEPAPSSPPASAPAFQGRSTYIDALRGLAALSVACYHINRYGPLPEPASEVIPSAFQQWFLHGWMGVQVFFVISGFVVAYSVRQAHVTWRYLGNYAIRRSIRLDPPYWSTIGLVFLLHWACLQFGFMSPLHVPEPTPVTAKQVLLHFTYTQNIFGYDNLSAGFWTLCIEVQFYLLFVFGFGVAQRLCFHREHASQTRPLGLGLVFGPLAILSLFVWHLDSAKDIWIVHFLCMFLLGAAAWWTLDERLPKRWFLAYAGLIAVRIIWQLLWREEFCIELAVALLAGLSIYFIGRYGRLGTTLNYGWLQYLGRISYSLYLVHFPVSVMVTEVGRRVSGERPSPAIATIWLGVALAASIGVAHVFYRLIERPSVKLASKLRLAS